MSKSSNKKQNVARPAPIAAPIAPVEPTVITTSRGATAVMESSDVVETSGVIQNQPIIESSAAQIKMYPETSVVADDVRIVSLEIPVADRSPFFAKRDLKIDLNDARLLARIATGLIEDGQTLDVRDASGTIVRQRPIERLEDVIQWLCEKVK